MSTYIYELDDWPRFSWGGDALTRLLADVRHRQGRLLGKMEALGFELRAEATLQSLTNDVIKSSEIEGEVLDRAQVRSSLARRLGMDAASLPRSDRSVEGVVEMMIDATQNYDRPLTAERLFGWHAALFPTGHSGMSKIQVGHWRDDRLGPMQVVSGPVGRSKVHFQAPAASVLEEEMRAFLQWANQTPQGEGVSIDPLLKAALAHFWFVTLHPFDDGNGRIARAIADLMLARSEGSAQRFYSMSAQISSERAKYYEILESSQKGRLDITPWCTWFLGALGRAIDGAVGTLGKVLHKAAFWDKHREQGFNDRQRKVINRLLDGFEGALTSSKWAKLTRCSQDSATRDINDLLQRGILVRNSSGGRSTSYRLSELGEVGAAAAAAVTE